MTFFRALTRRQTYETSADGSFYEYSRYRDVIAEDCEFLCVYCDIHEDAIGGCDAMEMDHFRPWNKGFGPSKEKKFEHLKNEPQNLVHACGVCNGFKWAHWPTENPERSYDHEKGWIDPFEESRANFLGVRQDGSVYAKKAPGQYQITKLRLNRPLLRRQRELRMLKDAWEKKVKPQWQAVVAAEPGTAHARTATEALQLFETIWQLVKIS